MYTPWGESQTVNQIAEGITHVTTAGHGGFLLSWQRHAAVKKRFPTFQTFAGEEWYEEDLDVAAVVVTFPEFFPPLAVDECRKAVLDKTYFGEMVP